MIEGDIDLTEGLDFYREKKTLEDKVYLPALRAFNKMPWKKKSKKPPKNWLNRTLSDIQRLEDINRDNGLYDTTYSNYSTTNSSNWTLYVDDQPISVGTYNYDDAIWMSNDSGLVSYCINQTTSNTNNWYSYYDIDNNSTSISIATGNHTLYWSNINGTLEIDAKPVKKPLFKYRELGDSLKNLLEKSVLDTCADCKRHYFPTSRYSSICPECRKKEESESSENLRKMKKIFSNNDSKDVIERLIDKYDLAYWYGGNSWNWGKAFEEDYDDGFDTQSDLFIDCYIRGTKLDRIGVDRRDNPGEYNETRKVPWLRKLSLRNYDNYMKNLWDEYDEENMEYLTKMSWIGVKKTEHVYE